MERTTIGFIGGGSMGFALAKAMARRFPQAAVSVYDLKPQRLELFLRELPGSRGADSCEQVAREAETLFLAVKPQDLPGVLGRIGWVQSLVVSIAAGFPLARLEQAMARARVVRVMPNTPGLVGEMAAGYAFGRLVTDADRLQVRELLEAAGYAAEVEERLLDAVTGLSSSGPAFVARLIEAFIAAGVSLGLPPEVARSLSLQTFRGTARLLAETGMQPQALVDMVSSPRGTTVAGLAVMEPSPVAEVILKTIQAAAARSKELGA